MYDAVTSLSAKPVFFMEQPVSHTLEVQGEAFSAEKSPSRWRQRWVEWGFILAFWTFMAVLSGASELLEGDDRQGQALHEILRAFSYYYFWALLTPGIFWLSRRFSIERTNWSLRILFHLAMAMLVAMGVQIYYSVAYHAIMPPPYRWPFDPLADLLRLWFFNDLVVYIAVLAAGFARDYFSQSQARREETVQLQAQAALLRAQLAEARLQALRMQINPHFLFNTLHAVSTLVERNPQGVRRMIAKLSVLLRHTLESSSEQEVSLEQELQFLDNYLDIQQIRFQGRLEVHREIEPAVLQALVPNLILQPLVENAIQHGVSKTDGRGYLAVCAWREDEHLCLSVRDNGPCFSGDGAASLTEGIGLSNTRARLQQMYGTAQSLTFRTADGGGLIAQITLPYHTTADLLTTAVAAQG